MRRNMETDGLILATCWIVKTEGDKRSIQLLDKKGNEIDGQNARWKGDFCCDYKNLTSLEGAPEVVEGYFSCFNNPLKTLEGKPRQIGKKFYCNQETLDNIAKTLMKDLC